MDEYRNGTEAAPEEAPAQESAALQPEEGPAEADDTRCALCKERERDTTESRHSVLCTQCRDTHIRLRLPPWVKGFLLATVLLFALAMVAFSYALPRYRQYAQAQRHMERHEYLYAHRIYQELLPVYGNNPKMAISAAEAAMGAQYFGDLNDIIDTYLVGKRVDDAVYTQANRYVQYLNDYGESMYEIMQVMDAFEAEEDASPEETTGALHRQLLALEDVPDRAVLYLYLGLTAADLEERIDYMWKACNEDTRTTYPYAQYGNALRRAGRLSEAEEIFQTVLGKNACDAEAYRGLSILQLLEGNPQEALETIRLAYALEPEGDYMLDALIVTLLENGEEAEAAPLIERLRVDGEIQDESLRGYLAGETDLRRYYLGEEA